MLISDRSKEIIENLMNANGPLTVSALSKKLGVTERTIYRQIPEVTEIIESYDLTLDNSSGNGFMIFGSLYNLKRLNSAFEEVKTEQNYSNKERVDIILLTLLNEDDSKFIWKYSDFHASWLLFCNGRKKKKLFQNVILEFLSDFLCRVNAADHESGML